MPARLAGVGDIWLCLGVLYLKSQIPSTKKQTSSKLQAPNSKEIPKFVIWNLIYLLLKFRTLIYIKILSTQGLDDIF